jgi:hypothetical protein
MANLLRQIDRQFSAYQIKNTFKDFKKGVHSFTDRTPFFVYKKNVGQGFSLVVTTNHPLAGEAF